MTPGSIATSVMWPHSGSDGSHRFHPPWATIQSQGACSSSSTQGGAQTTKHGPVQEKQHIKHCQKTFLVINMYCFDLWKCVQDRDSLGAARTAPPAPCLLRFLQRGHPALAASVGLHPASVPRLGACRAPPRAPQQLLPFPAGEGAGRCHLQLQPPGPRPGEDIPDLLGAGGTKGCPPQTLASELLLPHQPFPPLPGPI